MSIRQLPVSDIGKNIRYYRKLRGISQYKLARMADIPQQYIARIENGWQQDFTLRTGVAIAQALGVPCEALVAPISSAESLEQQS
jgi:transcriptional regulator with XRE-family HTH domain